MTALSREQSEQLVEEGYVVLPSLVDPALIGRALRRINHCLGEGIDPTKLSVFRAQSFCLELRREPEITDLFNESPFFGVVEQLLGPGHLERAGGGQIALRFPRLEPGPAPRRGHIDGLPGRDNGVDPNTISNFTLLAGVFLSDMPEPNMGNFTVLPGSHRLMAEYFKQRDPRELLDGMPELDYPPARAVTARAGDAVIAHHLTCHTTWPNSSPYVRYAVYFRVWRKGRDRFLPQGYRDLWREWPGLDKPGSDDAITG